MAKEKLPLNIDDLSGGMDAKTDPSQLADNTLVKLLNTDIVSIRGAISKRNGYEIKGDDSLSDSIDGLCNLLKKDGTNKVIKITGGDAYVYDNVDGTWEAQSQEFYEGYPVFYDVYLDKLFTVNYANHTKSFDGDNWTSTTNLSGAPKAKYIKVYQNKIYLGNVVLQPNAYPSRVYFSSLPDSDYEISWDTTEETGDYFEVDTDDGDVIRGLGGIGGRLTIYKEYSLHTWDGYERRKIEGAPGVNSARSIVQIGGWEYYFNRRGVYRFNGSGTQYISDPVKPYIDGISAASSYTCCAGEKDLHYYLYIGDVSNEDLDIEERGIILDFDTVTGNWSIHSINHRPRAFIRCPRGAF